MTTKTNEVTLTFETFTYRSVAVKLLTQHLSIDESVARSYVIKLIRAGRLTATMKEAAVKNTLNTFIQELHAASNGKPVDPQDAPGNPEPAADPTVTGEQIPPETAQPETAALVPTETAKSATTEKPERPPEESTRLDKMPIGQLSGVRLWRNYRGIDMEVWVSGNNVETMLRELDTLLDRTTETTWLQEKRATWEANKPLVKGATGSIVVDWMKVTEKDVPGVGEKIYLDFWRTGRDYAEASTSDPKEIALLLGQLGFDFEQINIRDLIGKKWENKYRLGYELGNLKKERGSQETKDPTKPWNWYWNLKTLERVIDEEAF